MIKFEKEYLSLFNQQKEEKISLTQQGKLFSNLKKKVGTLTLDNIFDEDDVFKGQSLHYPSGRFTSYEILEKYEISEEIQLTEGKMCQVKFNGDIQVVYDIGDYGGLEGICELGYPFEKSLNSQVNDSIILISVTSFDGETTTPKFSELSQQDKLLVFEGISDYFYGDEFFNDFNQILEDRADY